MLFCSQLGTGSPAPTELHAWQELQERGWAREDAAINVSEMREELLVVAEGKRHRLKAQRTKG